MYKLLCNLINYVRACGLLIPPGTRTKLHLIPISEVTAEPDTVAVVDSTTAAGDTKLTGEDFTYVATVGKGFWRQLDIWTDTGNIRYELEGEIGGQGFRQRLDFFILGATEVELEVAETLLCNSGCYLAAIEDKAGKMHWLGRINDPVYLEAATGGSGASDGRSGMQYTLFSNTGKTGIIIDTTNYPLDITPNPAP